MGPFIQSPVEWRKNGLILSAFHSPIGANQCNFSERGVITTEHETAGLQDWPLALYNVLKAHDVRQMAHVPDAGHTNLIKLFEADTQVTTNVLTTEEEGIAISVGAWLGGQRSVLLMQSSGVGNCINMLSLPVLAQTPLLMLVTMRGLATEIVASDPKPINCSPSPVITITRLSGCA